jgi:hypothetical protein
MKDKHGQTSLNWVKSNQSKHKCTATYFTNKRTHKPGLHITIHYDTNIMYYRLHAIYEEILEFLAWNSRPLLFVLKRSLHMKICCTCYIKRHWNQQHHSDWNLSYFQQSRYKWYHATAMPDMESCVNNTLREVSPSPKLG